MVYYSPSGVVVKTFKTTNQEMVFIPDILKFFDLNRIQLWFYLVEINKQNLLVVKHNEYFVQV